MPLRFLLVDDDDVDREVVSRLLSRIDPSFELVEAVNITDAREKLENGQFDCVLLDYHLGGARGLDLLPFVAAHRTEICPVILITLRETEALIVEAIRSGVSDYIAKGNLDEQRLHSVLDTVLARAAVEEQRLSAERHFRKLAESMRLNYEDRCAPPPSAPKARCAPRPSSSPT
jgi:DNA-binding NtrC family response regulator